MIERYKVLEKETTYIRSLEIDISAAEYKIKNMKLKIKNATLFLEEIDKHTKSIFEFWKFTNKDKIQQLHEAENLEENVQRLKKTFDINLDLEPLSRELDRNQRKLLTNEELNSTYLATTNIITDINKVSEGKEIENSRIEELREESLRERRMLTGEAFDIFGNVTSDRTKIQVLANKKHRETKRDKTKLVEINKNTTPEEYGQYLKGVLAEIGSAIQKTNIGTPIPVYKMTSEGELDNNLNIFDINITNEVDIGRRRDEQRANNV